MNFGSRTRAVVLGLTAAAFVGLTGCASVEERMNDVLTQKEQPPIPTVPASRTVAVPNLDERREEKQFLARIDQLQRRVDAYEKELEASAKERAHATKQAHSARSTESQLAADLEQVQVLLQESQAREKQMKEQLLRARLETVRLKKELRRRDIRELTTGTNE